MSSRSKSVFGIVVILLSVASIVASAAVPGLVTDHDQEDHPTQPSVSGNGSAVSAPSQAEITEGGGFLANHGQLARGDVRLYTSLGDLDIGFVPGAVLLHLRERPPSPFHVGLDGRFEKAHEASIAPQTVGGVLLRVAFDDANPVVPVGRDLLPYPTHFIFGNNPARWRTDVPSYREVLYHDLYEGIDLAYRLQDGLLKYEFYVQPGANPAAIQWTVEGADGIFLDPLGNLVLQTQAGDLVDDAPVVFQAGPGSIAVPSRYALLSAATVSIEVGAYDLSQALVIDPGLDYSTFLGGNSFDHAFGVAVDPGGNATITGYTNSPDFPTTSGSYDTSFNGQYDVFVLRLKPSGKLPVYSTFIGGSSDDFAFAIALDAGGNATVTGYASSADFPTTSGAFDTTHNGQNDVFVVRLNAAGSGLVYSTFVGGTASDVARAIALDPAGTATVTGYTSSAGFPATSGAFDTLSNGASDVFVFHLNAAGSGLLYSTFAGGSGDDFGIGLALGANGAATVTGHTLSANFPVTFGAYDTTFNLGYDAYVLRLNPAGSDLEYSTFVGHNGDDFPTSLATDGSGAATVAGYTNSPSFPTTQGAYKTTFGGGTFDAFLFRLDASGQSLAYSTFVGGSATDLGLAIGLDAEGTSTVTGYTTSANFPTTSGAFDGGYNGLLDLFVLRLSPTESRLLYSTFIGGSADDVGRAMALYTPATVFVAGSTSSDNFPTTPGAFDTTFNANGDAFALRLTASLEPKVSDLGVQGLVAAPGILHVTDFTPDLNWSYADPEGDPQSQYEVRVGTSSGGSEMWTPGPQTGPASTITYAGSPPSRGVDYYFAVRVSDGNAWSTWREVRFRLNEIPYAPTTPISPADGAAVPAHPDQTVWWTSGGDPDGDSLTFDWQVSTDPGFAAILSSGTTANPTSSPFATFPSTTYYWRVQAWDGYESSQFGNAPTGYWTFTTETPNGPPIADAGLDQIVRKQTLVALDGNASSDPDGDPISFMWTAPPGISLSATDVASPTFTPVDGGTYTFLLTVADDQGGSAMDSVTIVVENGAPNAKAGGNQTVQKHALVTLDGSSSSDPDGDPLSYQWQQLAGPAVILSGATTVTATFEATNSGAFLFSLAVDDGDGGSDTDTVLVTVENGSPTANAGPDRTAPKNALVTLDGSGSSDPDGDALSYQWGQVGGPSVSLSGMTTSIASFTPTVSGAYSFALTVRDADGESDSDSVLVTVENRDPSASAGPDQIVLKRALVTLDGSASSDVDGDPLTYRWQQVDGPAVALSGSTTPSATFTPTTSGTYGFILTVVDADGRTDTDSVVVTVQNRSPRADAGSDQNVLKRDVVTLAGSASSDPDGDPLTFVWEQVGGPSIALNGATTAAATFTPAVSGTYGFVLTVSDGDGGHDADSIVVVALNRPPVADAGPDGSGSKNALMSLHASGSFDPDDDPLSYLWSQVSGPSVALAGATTATATFTPTVAGTYAFALTVADGDGGTMTDYIMTVVENQPPVADAGPDQILSSLAPVSLVGAGSHDPDGDALTYAWQQVDGPAVTIAGAGEAVATFTPPRSATYVFQLKVSDGDGGAAEDIVSVTVQNARPVAMAGQDVVARKNTLVTLDGTGSSDPDGSPLSYAWDQIGGPAITLTGATDVTATFTPSTSGPYVFTLTVDDGDGGIDRDSVVISVENRGPTANAGSGQTGEPGSAISLDGAGSYDLDGDALSYSWTQEGGPIVTLSGAEGPGPRFVPTDIGTYVFRLTVTDADGASDVDTVLVLIKGPTVLRIQTPFPVEPVLVALIAVLIVLLILSFWRRRKGEEDSVVNEVASEPTEEAPKE